MAKVFAGPRGQEAISNALTELARFGAEFDNLGMDDNLPKPRRWFRFSLRTMFVVVALLSVPLSWVGYHINWIRQRREMLELVQKEHTVFWDGDPFPPDEYRFPLSLWILGERPVLHISVGHPNVDSFQEIEERAEAARRLFPESSVAFWSGLEPSQEPQ